MVGRSWHTRVPQNRSGHALLHTMTQEDLILSININPVLSGIITATLSAIFGSAVIIMQKSKLQTLNGLVFCFWFGILGTVISLLGSVALEDMTLPSDLNDIIMTGGHCLTAVFVSISSFYTHKYITLHYIYCVFKVPGIYNTIFCDTVQKGK